MQPLSVTNLVYLLKDVLEGSELFSDLWLRAEISNFSVSRLGHRYFSLGDESTTMRCVLFRDDMPGETFESGEWVLAHGRVSIYAARGELQFVCDFVRPEGVGIMAAQFEELHRRLEAEGLFLEERKRPLPLFPRRIGIVTSPAGAALHDVVNVLRRRWPLAELVVSPANVQGEQAPRQIVRALRRLRDETIDVAILARGGGGAEDLSAFNDETVARAIYGFPVPLVTGIGHETDVTIADFVADVRAPTPSAAAERATPDRHDQLERLRVLERRFARQAAAATRAAAELALLASRQLGRARPDLASLRRDVNQAARQMAVDTARLAARDRALVDLAEARMAGLSPLATLARGFAAVARADNGKPVYRVKQVRGGDRLSVAVSDGAFWTEVS